MVGTCIEDQFAKVGLEIGLRPESGATKEINMWGDCPLQVGPKKAAGRYGK